MADDIADLEQLSALAGQFADEEPASDRRRHPRTAAPNKIPAVIELIDRRQTLRGFIRDLSRGGIGLNVPVALALGTRFTLRATIANRDFRATCSVANCRLAEEPGRYIVGAELIQADRARLAPPPPASPPTEQPIDVDERHVADLRDRLRDVITTLRPDDDLSNIQL
ncbi:MAG TPA: PilZ domain-containing protein [Tepidisphaeraceae bacterium]|nr:PilZ domain-containing protein [Tepidisphaeraceae bacterium]